MTCSELSWMTIPSDDCEREWDADHGVHDAEKAAPRRHRRQVAVP